MAFAYGAWSQYVIKDVDDVIVFKNKDLDAKVLAHSYVSPLSTLCLIERLNHLSELLKSQSGKALVVFTGPDTNFGKIFLRLFL